jgi:hypothetical protein
VYFFFCDTSYKKRERAHSQEAGRKKAAGEKDIKSCQEL